LSTNIELERDIEKKSKIDEMRKSFISDVSHELKTPIALIQGYSEGLLENVNDEILFNSEIGLLNVLEIYIIAIPPTIITIPAIKYRNLLDILTLSCIEDIGILIYTPYPYLISLIAIYNLHLFLYL